MGMTGGGVRVFSKSTILPIFFRPLGGNTWPMSRLFRRGVPSPLNRGFFSATRGRPNWGQRGNDRRWGPAKIAHCCDMHVYPHTTALGERCGGQVLASKHHGYLVGRPHGAMGSHRRYPQSL